MKKLLIIALLICIKQVNAQTRQASFIYSQGANGTVTFTSTSTGTTANTTYFWNWDDNYAQVGWSSISHTYYYNGTYSVSLTINDSTTGCSSYITNTVVVSSAVPCNIHASFSITYDTAYMVTLTNTSTGIGPNASYTLHAGNGTSSIFNGGPGFSMVSIFPYNGQYVATLTVTGGGCTSTFADTFNITNGLTCNLVANYTDTLRNNGQADFYNTSTGVLSNMKAIWYYGDGTLPDTTNSPSHNYAYNGTYNVKLKMLDYYHRCKDSIVQTITITNAPNTCTATPSFSLSPNSSQAHAWFAVPNYSSQVINAIWTWGDGTSSTGLYPSHTYAAAGNYNICVKVYLACGDSSTYCQTDSLSRNSSANQIVQISVVKQITGISQITKINNQINLYPNPAQNNFTVEVSTNEKQTLHLFDVNGKQVLSQIINSTTSIDVSNLSQGVYNLSVISSDGVVNKRLVIVK
jgi:PKD repeat protein